MDPATGVVSEKIQDRLGFLWRRW